MSKRRSKDRINKQLIKKSIYKLFKEISILSDKQVATNEFKALDESVEEVQEPLIITKDNMPIDAYYSLKDQGRKLEEVAKANNNLNPRALSVFLKLNQAEKNQVLIYKIDDEKRRLALKKQLDKEINSILFKKLEEL